MVIISLAWSISFSKNACLGDHILQIIGVPAWSSANSGLHYTPFYSIPVLVIASIIAAKNFKSYLAKASIVLASILILFFILSVFYII